MMRSISVTILLTFVVQAYGKDLAVNRDADAQRSTTQLVDSAVDKFVNKLFDRTLKVAPLDYLSSEMAPSSTPTAMRVAESVTRSKATLADLDTAVAGKVTTEVTTAAPVPAAPAPVKVATPVKAPAAAPPSNVKETVTSADGHKIAAAGVLLWIDKEHVLVGMKQQGARSKDGWMEFGGKIKPGETPEDCARRKLREEAGLNPEDHQIDWTSPTLLTQCQYVSYNGKLGDKWPDASNASFAQFKKINVNDIPPDSQFRLRKVILCALKDKEAVKDKPTANAAPSET